MGERQKDDEITRLWNLHGDHVASVPLGRDGLASLLDAVGERRVDRGTLDRVVKMARTEGGPNTPPTPKGLKASRGKTVNFLKTFVTSENIKEQAPPSTQLEEGEVGIEGIEVDRTLYLYDEAADEYKTFVAQAKAWICLLYTSPSPRDS